jgi:hypothetical protein
MKSHSYAGRYNVTISEKNEDFKEYDKRLGETIFFKGLTFEATKTDEVFRLEFTLLASEPVRRIGIKDAGAEARFHAFDGTGGLLGFSMSPANDAQTDLPAEDQVSSFEREIIAQSLTALRQDLATCESVILCLPIDGRVPEKEINDLNERIFELRKRRNIRRLLVCFTMYEKRGLGVGRDAYRRMSTRSQARRLMSVALSGTMERIRLALHAFHRKAGKAVWCVPVSAYGFVPGSGGPNCNPADAMLLLTREPRPKQERSDAAPYEATRGRYHWRPFLTLDPFVFIATGDRKGTLIHRFDEL